MGQIFVYINMPIVDTLFCLPQYINLLITRVSSLFAGKYQIDFAFVDVSRGFFYVSALSDNALNYFYLIWIHLLKHSNPKQPLTQSIVQTASLMKYPAKRVV